MNINQLTIIKKAYKVNQNIFEGYWYYGHDYFWGSKNQAKYHFLNFYFGVSLNCGNDLEKYTQIRVLRERSQDIVLYENREVKRSVVIAIDIANKEKEKDIERKKTIENSKSDFFYVQHGIVGNSILFWAKNSCGYTSHLNKAERYSKYDILKGFPWREEDRIYPADLIKEASSVQVDSQNLKVNLSL